MMMLTILLISFQNQNMIRLVDELDASAFIDIISKIVLTTELLALIHLYQWKLLIDGLSTHKENFTLIQKIN